MEMLVVVLIIGIVAAIIVPRVSVSTSNSRDTVQAHQLTQLNELIELYRIENDSWPTALTDIETAYLPGGLPTPPQGGSYTYNSSTNRAEHTP